MVVSQVLSDGPSFENTFGHPFILTCGLNQNNIIEAINLTGTEFIDINSGVEEIKGEKNLTLIDNLISSLKNQ